MSHGSVLKTLNGVLGILEMGGTTAAEKAIKCRLEELSARLHSGRFQLAAVGQFKRGKSTLLNALLNVPVLPTGVIPLTAIPSFIIYSSEPGLSASFIDKPNERCSSSIDGVARLLAELATESGNPRNGKGVKRIDITLPSPVLRDGLVLIDTPGIGSAELHNSQAAFAALPECDAALFVLSPDPPITEAELAYLEAVQHQAALVVPVLTKSDSIASDDIAIVEGYLATVLQSKGVTEPIIVVSARKPHHGLDKLRARIGALAGDSRRRLLERAIARKVADALHDLAFHNQASLAALRLPIDLLDEKVAAFRATAEAIEREHDAAFDVTSGDRRRLLDIIDREAKRVRSEAQATLCTEYLGAAVADRNALFGSLSKRSSLLFEDAYRGCASLVEVRLSEIADSASGRILAVLARIRKAAAEILGIAFSAPAPLIDIEAPKTLAWIERQQESMSPVPPGFLNRFLPPTARQRAQREWLMREIDRLVTRNSEHLRWTLHQQAVDTLRRFDGSLRDHLANAGAVVIDLMTRARDTRTRSAQLAAVEIGSRERRSEALSASLADLATHLTA